MHSVGNEMLQSWVDVYTEAEEARAKELDHWRWELGDWLVKGAPLYPDGEVICGHKLPNVLTVAHNLTG